MNIDYYTTFDEPVPFKTLLLYPVKLRDYMLFLTVSTCLQLDKNSIPDAKIISMTELEYIYSLTVDGNNIQLLFFDRLLSLVLKDDESFKDMEASIKRYRYDENGKPYFIIGEQAFTPADFLEIKNIISAQNMVELPDYNMSKEVRDSLKAAKEYKERLSGSKPGSFEDYIVALASSTGWTIEYIYGLTIRKFIKAIRRMDNIIHYKIYLSASMSGMVKFEDTSFIKHWLSDLEEDDKYKDVSMDLDALKGKISLDSAKGTK